jgi:mRNA interferase RelE/StbE
LRYIVEISDQAEDQLKKLPHEIAHRIRNKLKSLEGVDNPRKYLRQVEGLYDSPVYRYRIGDYRAFLTFKNNILVIVVIGIGNRKNVYS